MFELREDEPAYAKLPCTEASVTNAHGNPIDLIASSTVDKGTSLYINADAAVGETQNRNKQHGFHFTADNCIGCHACEAACSEKNDLPAHISFRSVGYVEGGTYPDLTRMNLSMACNHCDDPVCLKGCPTNAYTKHSEYGAVLQDPDACFGCGYCTWVCPYNAPQLDPVEGHVQKCNMCVDRLEVGLKPACVSACVGNALEFGVIDTLPENREEIKTTIPGFPDPAISKPNIRFQQTKSLPNEFTRPDSEQIKYQNIGTKNESNYVPVVDADINPVREWNLASLSSRENPLVIFTLITQAVVGAFSIIYLAGLVGLETLSSIVHSTIAAPLIIVLTALQAFVLFLSTQHLGKPLRFYRGFNNLRYSPLSREALAITIFFGLLPMLAALLLINYGLFDVVSAESIQNVLFPLLGGWGTSVLVDAAISLLSALAVIIGAVGIYYMNRIYRIKARPFWDHWQVFTSFFGVMFSIGAIVLGLLSASLAWFAGVETTGLIVELLPFAAFGLAIEAIGHFFHARDLELGGREGAASLHSLKSKFGKTYRARNLLLGCWIALACLGSLFSDQLQGPGLAVEFLFALAAIGCLLTSIVSRALFYVIVVPTTMPGAFFWKNKGFEEHARETGLAKMPQVGVVELGH